MKKKINLTFFLSLTVIVIFASLLVSLSFITCSEHLIPLSSWTPSSPAVQGTDRKRRRSRRNIFSFFMIHSSSRFWTHLSSFPACCVIISQERNVVCVCTLYYIVTSLLQMMYGRSSYSYWYTATWGSLYSSGGRWTYLMGVSGFMFQGMSYGNFYSYQAGLKIEVFFCIANLAGGWFLYHDRGNRVLRIQWTSTKITLDPGINMKTNTKSLLAGILCWWTF